MENKNTIIEGKLEYTIEILPTGDWQIEYDRSIENEITSLSIAQNVVEHSLASLYLAKKTTKGKSLKSIKKQIEKLTETLFGVKMLCDTLCASYNDYKESQEKHNKEMLTAEITEKDKDLICDLVKQNKLKIDGNNSN